MLRIVCFSLAVFCVVPLSIADVQSAGEGGFEIRIETEVAGSPALAYSHFVDRIGDWWDDSHTYSQDSKNLLITAKPGGWWIEKLPGKGFVQHMEVLAVQPGEMIRFSGGLGPLQEMACDGALTVRFREGSEAGTCRIELLYNVHGYADGGLTPLAAPVDGVLKEQLQRLKKSVEAEN